MPQDMKQVARLLRDNAERFRALATSQPQAASDLEEQASKSEKLAAELVPSQDRREGPWMKCAPWIEPDRPDWGQRAEQMDAASLDRYVEALVLYKSSDDGWHVTEDEAKRAHFFSPTFLPGVVLAHVLRKDRETEEAWTAFFHLTENKRGTYQAGSFDFQSLEVHRLNREVPLQLVGHELEYFRYFMFVVRGDLGAFRLLDGAALERAIQRLRDQAGTPPAVNGSGERAAHSEVSDPLRYLSRTRFTRVTAEGAIGFLASVLYDRNIFEAELLVHPDGMVEMRDDKPLVQEEALAE